jgi:hypothetical protein
MDDEDNFITETSFRSRNINLITFQSTLLSFTQNTPHINNRVVFNNFNFKNII